MKHRLVEVEESSLFNDLLILRHIVPSLPKEIIRELLLELKPHSSTDGLLLDSSVNFDKINLILARADRPTRLLNDFLACAGLNRQKTHDF
jgi:hypothetical protein